MKNNVIENFVSDRVECFTRILTRTRCLKFTKEQIDYLVNLYKITLHTFYFDELQKELIKDNKQVVRVELVLVDK